MTFTKFSYHSSRQMSESFVIAALLSISGGLQDVYTYIARDHVFANAQTGNIVLLSTNICERNWSSVLHYAIPVLFFMLGVAATILVRQTFQNLQRFHWRQIVVLIELILLFCVGFMPEKLNLIANALVSFSCAMQVQAFRKVNSYAYASTMCIGNMRSGVDAFCDYTQTHDIRTLHKSFHYFGVILLFACGAAVGSSLIAHFGMHTIWISCALLLISFVIMFIQKEERYCSDST